MANDHYLSQFWLLGFAANKAKKEIWAYNVPKERMDTHIRRIKSIASIESGWDAQIEKTLCLYETAAKPAINKIIASYDWKKGNFSLADYMAIARFVAMQVTRSLVSSLHLEDHYIAWVRAVPWAEIDLHDIRTRLMESIRKEWLVEQMADFLFQKETYFVQIDPQESDAFICGDWPIIMDWSFIGAAHEVSEWIFPLTEKILIVFSRNRNTKNQVQGMIWIPIEKVREINKKIARQASRYILGSKETLVKEFGEIRRAEGKEHFYLKDVFEDFPPFSENEDPK